MTTHWAIDLGTSNTTICEDRSGRPHTVNLPDLAKLEPLTQTPVLPSCVCILDRDGEEVLIGQEAVTYNWDGQAAGFARGFKRYLDTESGRAVARVGGRIFTAQDVASFFLREVIGKLEAQFGEDITDVTIATPSGFYETYRAELQAILRSVKHRGWWERIWARLRGKSTRIVFRTLDEPVAAALGYGVDVGRATTLVAFDFGGGSMEAAVVRTHGARTVETGRADVLAKQAVELGGDDVDRWILERFVPTALHDWPDWEVALRWEAERVKLLASAGREGDFTFRNETYGKLDYNVLSDILAEHGLYARIRELLDALLAELQTRHGVPAAGIEDVILEGGSTLLPEVRNVVADVLGREKVREWLPFASVARGACIFAGGAHVEDFIYHDYALRVLPHDDADAEYELLIPGGTSFPTVDNFVTRYYAPGFDGQQHINLFICEVGRVAGRPVDWTERANGSSYFVPGTAGERAFCLCLNEADPALPLNPAGKGASPRLRVTYSVDENRWLCVTVHDLHRKTDLRVEHPVVRLR
ncbi:Hsp70 family protein [Candidatus Palauibacter sp.]|uniref:Hsp70 family protein n=1 Tax=Candidatus Palauibacter sp. TaxID=3101350 RepID=UPI003AF2B6B9